MGFDEYKDFSVIDSHIHFPHPNLGENLVHTLDEANVKAFNIVCTPHQQRLSLVPDALFLKAHYPDRCYVFGGLDISALFVMPENAGTFYADYIDTLLDMGCDGIKMIEGKVQMRKTLPIPDFDGPVYAPYWEKMEEKQAPLVFHVNDPEEFWDPDRIPDWARTMGWFYGDGTYINNEVQYKQVLNVLKRHPHLKVIFAHFFFLSAQLERLADYLDQFPNMHVDLTPGIEMYFNFALDVDKTRDFFMKYQDRIVFGTDIGAKALLTSPDEGINKTESFSRIHVIRSFLEHEGGFKLENNSGFLFGDPNHQFSGIGLADEVLEKIYHLNFKKLTGFKPSKIKPEAIAEECKRIIFMLGAMAGFQTGQAVDTSIAEEVKTYFEAHF